MGKADEERLASEVQKGPTNEIKCSKRCGVIRTKRKRCGAIHTKRKRCGVIRTKRKGCVVFGTKRKKYSSSDRRNSSVNM